MIDASSPLAEAHQAHHQMHLISGPTTWFHVKGPRASRPTPLPHTELSSPAVQALLQWLLHEGSLYSTELRMCGSGQHRGIWLGLTGHGATLQHAREVSHEGRLMLASFFRLNQWTPTKRDPPSLPRWKAGLRFAPGRSRLESQHGLLPQRACVTRLAERGAPMVLQLCMQTRGLSPELSVQTGQLRRGLETHDGHRLPANLVRHRHEMIDRLQDEAADLTARVSLYAARAPSPMRQRKFAHAFPGSRVLSPWGPEPTPTPAGVSLLRDSLALMARKETP